MATVRTLSNVDGCSRTGEFAQFKLLNFPGTGFGQFAKNHRMTQQVYGLGRLSDLPELKARAAEVLQGLDEGLI